MSVAPITGRKFKFYGAKNSECLREVSKEVEEITDSIKQLVEILKVTIAHYGAQGLAAPQIGTNLRIFVVNVSGEPKVFINPEIVHSEGESKATEGCLSFPGSIARIIRKENVLVKALDEHGEEFTMDLDGVEAVAVQHELDHLNGVLFIDKMSPLYKRRVLKNTKKMIRRFNL